MTRVTLHDPLARQGFSPAPPGREHGDVWDVDTFAALSAIDRGRFALRAASCWQEDPGPSGLLDQTSNAQLIAVADFWARMRGFANLGVPRVGWWRF